MKILSKTEARYMASKGVEDSILSKNAYVPKEIEVQDKTYGFYVNEEEGYVQVLTVLGATKTGSLVEKEDWKVYFILME